MNWLTIMSCTGIVLSFINKSFNMGKNKETIIMINNIFNSIIPNLFFNLKTTGILPFLANSTHKIVEIKTRIATATASPITTFVSESLLSKNNSLQYML